jgi:serine O-acetyltransferase
MNTYILDHDTFGAALVTILSHKLSGDLDQAAWKSILDSVFLEVYENEITAERTCMEDLSGIIKRDPACESLAHAFMNFKGFKALATHRMAHVLWRAGRREVALVLQSRCSEVFGVDIHPAARIGPGNVPRYYLQYKK